MQLIAPIEQSQSKTAILDAVQLAEPQDGLPDVVENRDLIFPADDFERCVDG